MGESRPAWKVLRVFGNLFELDGFDFISSEEVSAELFEKTGTIEKNNVLPWSCPSLTEHSGIACLVEVSPGRIDNVIRRAKSFASTAAEQLFETVRMNERMVAEQNLESARFVLVKQGNDEVILDLVIDNCVADGSVLVQSNSRLGLAAGSRAVQLKVAVNK